MFVYFLVFAVVFLADRASGVVVDAHGNAWMLLSSVGRGEWVGVLWVLWTLLKNGISRLLSGFDSIVGGRGWVCGTLALSGVVFDCSVTRSRMSHP